MVGLEVGEHGNLKDQVGGGWMWRELRKMTGKGVLWSQVEA